MKKVLLTITILSVCMLAGCGAKYSRPGATQSQYDRDKMACDYDVMGRLPEGNPLFYSQMFQQCMQLKGWRVE